MKKFTWFQSQISKTNYNFLKSIFHLHSLYSIFHLPTQEKLFFKFYFMTPPLTFYFKLKKTGICISSHLFYISDDMLSTSFHLALFHLNYSIIEIFLILCSCIILQYSYVYSAIFLLMDIWGILILCYCKLC